MQAAAHRTGHVYISYGHQRRLRQRPRVPVHAGWQAGAIVEVARHRPRPVHGAHNIAVDREDRVHVADRKAHHVQVFDGEGNLLAVWNNIYRPCGLTVGPVDNIYIGESNGVALVQGCPGYGPASRCTARPARARHPRPPGVPGIPG